MFSGAFAFLGVFYTIKYYKESDEQKTKISIQPFLLVTIGTKKEGTVKKIKLSQKTEQNEIDITIKNIGNGFANTLVIHTGDTIGGKGYNKVILVGESESLSFLINPYDLVKGKNFGIQYIDAMRNEYIQEYTIIENEGQIDIECGYPQFLKQR